jgi:protein-S-isoprenylcysteine O-methyltransferase Ste14
MSGWRHARAIALLPGFVTLVIPAVLLWLGGGPEVGWGGPLAPLTVAAGAALTAAGLALWVWTVRLFARLGRGTLAPWDPTRALVVQGPYGVVRNPMITGVLAVLVGEATLLGSAALLAWAAVFFAVNSAFFVLREEPELERRFGEPYRRYRRHVPRWIPRRRAWRPAP